MVSNNLDTSMFYPTDYNNIEAIYITDHPPAPKPKKKPGRKPNPASPALRKAQNRAAQRAFRERKEHHLKDLEGTIRQLREQRHQTQKLLDQKQKEANAYQAENWYLKGVVLTLQFVCLHHGIHIPTHSPYLTEDALIEMSKTTPHAIEAYVNAYTKNNINLKPTLASHFSSPKPSPSEDFEEPTESVEPAEEKPSSLSGIQQIRLQLRVQSTLSEVSHQSAARLQPTILQLAVPHDPRIDLIPAPHMRDRMIIFREQMDYDQCFQMLLNGAVYNGGDATMSESWVLPPEFFAEYWYLAINYDSTKTSSWKELKGAQKQQQKSPAWSDEVFHQFTAGMPSLEPLDSSHLTSGFDFGSPAADVFQSQMYRRSPMEYQDLNHPLFEHIVHSSNFNSGFSKSPSLDSTMVDFMETLSTNM